MFFYRCSDDTVYLLLHVDHSVQHRSSSTHKFVMKDLGPLHHFRGIAAERRPHDLFLHQR
jgi:hypothetical protein